MDVAEEMRLTDRQRYWLEQIKACVASGKSVAAYAAEHGFEARALYGAKKVLVKKGVLPRTQGVRFQRAQVVASMADSKWHIQLPNGVSVDFSGSVDAGTLSTILNTAVGLG
jgi:hypothetical protein